MKKTISILWGVVFIIIGIIIALNALGVTNINLFFDGWWTLFLIIPCFIDLFDGDDLTGSIIGIVIGIVLLLCCQDVITFDLIWKLALPSVLILVGISIILRSVVSSNKEIFKKNKSELNIYCATFGEQNINLANEKFIGANNTAIFGSINMDLSESKIPEDSVIYATSIFGGIDIKVPNDVKVVIKSIPIFGSVNNKRKNPKDSKVKTIYVKGVCIFGGIEIK